MIKDVDPGIAGSITMIVLIAAVVVLLRSFYKRYTRLQARGEKDEN